MGINGKRDENHHFSTNKQEKQEEKTGKNRGETQNQQEKKTGEKKQKITRNTETRLDKI